MLFGAFRPPKPENRIFRRYSLDRDGYICSRTEIIFHPQVCAQIFELGIDRPSEVELLFAPPAFALFFPDDGLRPGLSSARPVQIRFFKLANLTSAGAFGDPKSSGNKPSNEGHGFSRAVNSRRLTASAAEVRFSRATGAKSSLSRLSFSSTQLENVLPFRRQPINRTNPIWFGQAPFKAINKLHRQKVSCSANLDSLG
jgi:hypothetical protein